MLRGRRNERETLDRLLGAIRSGRSAALVMRGEPGIGKTELLDYAVDAAPDLQVSRAMGVESEMELAFAGLHQLCAPVLGPLDQLPDPQRDALRVAFGLSSGEAPDRFLVGLATLSLLADVAERRPLLCVIDDWQWLDRASAQVLAFAARRLVAESVAVVIATRELSRELEGLPELVVEGLPPSDAADLLGSALRAPLDERVRHRIVAETRGNPLALLELPRGLTPEQLAGGFGVPEAPGISDHIEESFRRRFLALPAETRLLLLIAAAEPLGEPMLLWRAGEMLGVGAEHAQPAIDTGLVDFGAPVTFRHPLVRSAIYGAASRDDRRPVHRVLAEATDPLVDPDRRAWHRAHATMVPDEDVAQELATSAERAQARGGLAAAAAFLQRAAELTPERGRRAERALSAAQVKHLAGAADAALELLDMAEAGPLDALQHARADLVRAQVAFAMSRGSDAPPQLLGAAKQLERLDVGLAREAYLEAFSAGLFAGRLARGAGMPEIAAAIRSSCPLWRPRRASDLLLHGLARLTTDGPAAAAPMLKQALRDYRGEHTSRADEMRWLWLAGHVSAELWDDAQWHELAIRHVGLAREAGALSELPTALSARIGLHVFAGEFAEAAALTEEAQALTPGRHVEIYGAVPLAAWRGREAELSELVETAMSELVARGGGIGLGIIGWARGVLYNSLGRYEEALSASERAVEYVDDAFWALPELIEAAARVGETGRARDALRALAERTRAGGADWGLGVEARSRALVTRGQLAEDLYRRAIDHLGRTRMRVDLARGHLLYGEWLRRHRRRADARDQLRRAYDLFVAMGADGFADRAERELAATGETIRPRSTAGRDELTAQEVRIARMARDGASNQEIASELFISRKTVEYHLGKVFTKLGIGRRNQLHDALGRLEAAAVTHRSG